MFKASFEFQCDVCGKTDIRHRSYGDKLRVDKQGSGTFDLRPFYSWNIMEVCFDRRYNMTGPHNEDMLTFKYAACGDECRRRLDSLLADVTEKHHYLIKANLDEEMGLRFKRSTKS